MADFYELMVKEYLEQQGYIVRLCVRFLKNRGYSDIDVLAINPITQKIILGEVKGYGLNRKAVDQENEDFNNEHMLKKVRELTGTIEYSKYIFCWSAEEETKKYALEKYQITIIEFPEIINQFIERVRESRKLGRWIYNQKFPNTMLLQLLSTFNKPRKGMRKLDLSKLEY